MNKVEKNPALKLNSQVVHEKMQKYEINGVKVFNTNSYLDPFQIKQSFSSYLARIKKGSQATDEEVKDMHESVESLEQDVDTAKVREICDQLEVEESSTMTTYHPLTVSNA